VRIGRTGRTGGRDRTGMASRNNGRRPGIFRLEENQRCFVDISTTKSICGWLVTDSLRLDACLGIGFGGAALALGMLFLCAGMSVLAAAAGLGVRMGRRSILFQSNDKATLSPFYMSDLRCEKPVDCFRLLSCYQSLF